MKKGKEKLREKFERINLTGSKVDRALVINDNNKRDCILAKIKRKNLKKESLGKYETPGERLLMDVSYI